MSHSTLSNKHCLLRVQGGVDTTRKVKEMPAKKISDLQKEKYYSEGGVADFKLQITSQDAKSWILRVKVGSKRFYGQGKARGVVC